jgi:hypothetical protein
MSELDEIKDAIDRAGVWPGSQPRDYVASVRNMADELTSLLDKLELARLERDEAQDTITGLRNEIRAPVAAKVLSDDWPPRWVDAI